MRWTPPRSRRICAALVHREGGALLAELEALHARGLEMKRVAEEIVRHLRNLVVAKLVPSAPLDLPDGELAEVRAQAAAADAAQLTRLFDLAQQSVVDVKLAEQPRYALEVALLEGVFLAPGAQVSELVARLEALARGAPRRRARRRLPRRQRRAERRAAAGRASPRSSERLGAQRGPSRRRPDGARCRSRQTYRRMRRRRTERPLIPSVAKPRQRGA